MNNLVSSLFPSNKIDLDKLDAIMEDPESSKYSESKSEGGDMDIDDEQNGKIENSMMNYREFFKIFRHININDYFTDIHPVS
jgi:hypothetical protein